MRGKEFLECGMNTENPKAPEAFEQALFIDLKQEFI